MLRFLSRSWFTFLLVVLPLLIVAVPSAAQEKPAEKPKTEFKRGKGYVPLPPAERKKLHDAAFKRHGYLMKWLAKTVTPPAVFDCTTLGIVGPVVDQGQCGDCYGVSACDAMTGAWIKAGWGKNDGSFKISDQCGLDCGYFQGGCNGGDEAQVIDLGKTQGFPAEKYVDQAGNKQSDYGPYTASPGKCQLKSGAKMWQLKDWGYVAGDQGQGPATLDQHKAALMTYGQLSIALDASSFNNYSGGVITSLGNNIDHAITEVGWDDNKQGKMKTLEGNEVTTTGAIHCRNNWGTSWGENGYCWIAYAAVPQIVEPIWLLAPSVTPPPPPPVTVPVITSATTATATVGTGFTFQVTASGAPTGFAATRLPGGLMIDPPSGLIAGTPTAAGAFTATLTATNASGSGTGALTITVGTTPPPPPGPGGPVNINLTPDQVASVNSQSGALVITGGMSLQQLVDAVNAGNGAVLINKGMTLKELLDALSKSKGQSMPSPAPCPPAAPMPPAKDDGVKKELEALKADNAELKRAVEALLKAAVKKKE